MTDEEWNKLKYRQRKEMRLAEGRCVRCGKPNDRAGKALICTACKDKDNAARVFRRLDRRGKSLCITCGKPVGDWRYKTCAACREKRRKRYNDRQRVE